ncbi:hypothetical protein Rxyl_1106 [Rubrobacter xylanophilus DSM 9941]|uniref:Hemolysin-type calcium-binding region n=2 Tax=Rubrobacter xylanophilus TaxID=49319 RepID=Q1AX06_RUBXD|nr:hypothetical protein Rxyl_1106 [Rubrobacter xylanophilus DSM 9941]
MGDVRGEPRLYAVPCRHVFREQEESMGRRLGTGLLCVVSVVLLAAGVAAAAVIYGTAGSDAINGTPGKDRIYGLRGDDAINGFGRADRLYGGRGADGINGGPGDDLLVQGPVEEYARDSLNGGRGDDRIRAANSPAVRDVVTCGPGFDRVHADARDLVASDCELVGVAAP